MFSGLVSLINKSLSSSAYTPQIESTSKVEASNNPFSSQASYNNPFSEVSFGSNSESYGKNQPVAGGYFAGYYNGVPNIVGRKLFIEV